MAEGALTESRRGRAVGVELRGRAAAARFGLAAASVKRWVRRFRERGHVRADARGGGPPSRVEAERERIVRLLEARPELTSRALSEALAAEGVRLSDSTLRKFLRRHRMERRRRLAVRLRRRRWKAPRPPVPGSRPKPPPC